MAFIKLDYFDWVQQFKPLTKPGTDHNAFDTHDDVEFLRKQPANTIWTLVQCSETGDLVTINGCHWINRLEYYVTEVPFSEGDEYNVE